MENQEFRLNLAYNLVFQEKYLEGIKIYETILPNIQDNTLKKAEIYRRIGNAYAYAKNYLKAKENLEKSLGIYQKKEFIETSSWDCSSVCTALQGVYSALGNNTEAYEYAKKAYDFNQKKALEYASEELEVLENGGNSVNPHRRCVLVLENFKQKVQVNLLNEKQKEILKKAEKEKREAFKAIHYCNLVTNIFKSENLKSEEDKNYEIAKFYLEKAEKCQQGATEKDKPKKWYGETSLKIEAYKINLQNREKYQKGNKGQIRFFN